MKRDVEEGEERREGRKQEKKKEEGKERGKKKNGGGRGEKEKKGGRRGKGRKKRSITIEGHSLLGWMDWWYMSDGWLKRMVGRVV